MTEILLNSFMKLDMKKISIIKQLVGNDNVTGFGEI